MTDTQAPYTIVVGVDFEADGDRAVEAALELAETYGGRAAIHIVHVEVSLSPHVAGLETGLDSYERERGKRIQAALDTLEQRTVERAAVLVQRGVALSVEGVTGHYRLGSAAQQIVQLAAEVDADLIVVGTHGRKGVKRVLLGSVAASVLRLARCPVFVVRPKDHEELGEVPEIEPPCPACVATRKASGGEQWWCKRHGTERRPLAHRYHYSASITRSAPAPWGPSMG